MKTDFIERSIAIGFITSTEFIKRVYEIWDSSLIESSPLRLLIGWCLDFYNNYKAAPRYNIQGIYTEKLKNEELDKDTAELIELILTSLSDEYNGLEPQDIDYLTGQTIRFLKKRKIKQFHETLAGHIESGMVHEAEELIQRFRPIQQEAQNIIDPFAKESVKHIKKAFEEKKETLIHYPKALGRFWNHELTRSSFVAFMGREKIGKTFLLVDMAIRAVKSGKKTIFFQAGDMSEKQQIRRMAIYLTRRSDQARYCNGMWVPVVDCVFNQTDDCNEEIRESDSRIFNQDQLKKLTYETLVQAVMRFKEHKPCTNCDKFRGAVWLKWKKSVQPLTWKDAYKEMQKFGRKHKAGFKLATYSNETLTIREILSIAEEFEPDVIIIDYADILAPDRDISRFDFRQQQNKIWQRLRRLSEECNCLVVTATQAKATAYSKTLIDLSDYSEDKRKFAHVTAMYGLNQTAEEKRIGLMRINELVVREADFNIDKPVTVLQRLQMGRPVLGSYF